MRFKKQNETVSGMHGVTYSEAVAIQSRLREELKGWSAGRTVRTVAGADVAVAGDGTTGIAGFAAFSWPDLELIDLSIAVERVEFPYIPGLLSFREIPVLIEAYARLSVCPDVIFCDGQGRAHPRRFGLACHLGVVLNTATIGCAKSRLVGEAGDPGPLRGDWADLVDRGEVIGKVLRTRDNVRPLYVSAGHMMDVDRAVEMVLEANGGCRIPEPTRRAHMIVAQAKGAMMEGGYVQPKRIGATARR